MATILGHCYEQVDYISLHSYYDNRADDLSEYLADSVGMGAFIDSVANADDRHDEPWRVGPPLLEESYTFEDALVVGCLIITLLKHADRVKIACLAQLVNIIAPISTVNGGPAWRQAIFYPFLHASRYGRGTALDIRVDPPTYESKRFGPVPYLEATATVDEELGEMAIFAVNRSPAEAVQLEMRLELSGAAPKAVNTIALPNAVVPRRAAEPGRVDGGILRASLPPLSWNVIRLAARAKA